MIRPGPELTVYIMWGAWVLSWHIAALWTAPVTARSRASWVLPFIVASIVGFVLLLGFIRPGHQQPFHLWDAGSRANWAFAALSAVGFLFMVWARVHLGKLWSGGMVMREGHRVVDSGPYAIVRHPIYTGLLLAGLGTVLIRGTALSLGGLAVLGVSYYLKARLEEKFLRTELGAEAYDSYARRVPMLLPRINNA